MKNEPIPQSLTRHHRQVISSLRSMVKGLETTPQPTAGHPASTLLPLAEAARGELEQSRSGKAWDEPSAAQLQALERDYERVIARLTLLSR